MQKIIDFLEETLDTYTGLWKSHTHYGEVISYQSIHTYDEIGVLLNKFIIPDSEHKYFDELCYNVENIPAYIKERLSGRADYKEFDLLIEDIQNIINVSRCKYNEDFDYYKFGTVQNIIQLIKNAMFTEDDQLESAKKIVIDRMLNDRMAKI